MGTRMRARRGGEQWCAAPVAPLRKRAVTIALCAAASEALAQVWRRPTVKGFESLSDDVALQRLALCSRTDVSHACDASLELAQHLEARFQAGQYASLYQQATYTWRNTATGNICPRASVPRPNSTALRHSTNVQRACTAQTTTGAAVLCFCGCCLVQN